MKSSLRLMRRERDALSRQSLRASDSDMVLTTGQRIGSVPLRFLAWYFFDLESQPNPENRTDIIANLDHEDAVHCTKQDVLGEVNHGCGCHPLHLLK